MSKGSFRESVDFDLMSELSGGHSDAFDPLDVIGASFIRNNTRGIPMKATVVECDEETGKVLLEYAYGAQEWVEPNLVQEALLSQEDNDANMWTFSEVLGHRQEGNQTMVEIQWDNGEVSWEPLNVMRKDDPSLLHLMPKKMDWRMKEDGSGLKVSQRTLRSS